MSEMRIDHVVEIGTKAAEEVFQGCVEAGLDMNRAADLATEAANTVAAELGEAMESDETELELARKLTRMIISQVMWVVNDG